MGSLEQERPSRSKGSHRASINPAGKFQVCTGQRGLGLQHVGAEKRMGRSSSARKLSSYSIRVPAGLIEAKTLELVNFGS